MNWKLDKLEQMLVIKQMLVIERCGTPLVPVNKVDGKVRICADYADYKLTVNKYLDDYKHLLPLIEEIFEGGQHFTKLDFNSACNVLDSDTQKLLEWNTHRGIVVMRLPYGTKPAYALFQKIIETVLQGVDGVANFIDDIVVTGKTFKKLENYF